MTTVRGVKMSPRMERLWRFIREERLINLSDYSTDGMVESCQGSLREGETVLIARLARDPENRDLVNLLDDYRTIMNRRPRERVTDANVKASGESANVSDGDNASDKIRNGGW